MQPHKKLDGASLMNHLFNRLDGIYPNKWRANFKDDQSIRNWELAWAEAFDEEGVLPQDVANGLKNCRRMFDWPPSLTEFLRACRPYLEPSAAHSIAVEGLHARSRGEVGNWPHPAIFWAAAKVGEFDLLSKPYREIESRWSQALENELSKGEWDMIPEPVKRIEESTNTEVSERLRKETSKLVSQMTSKPQKNYRSWAWKILNKPEGKAHIAVRKAKECLIEYEPTELRQWVNENRDAPGRRGEIAKELENES